MSVIFASKLTDFTDFYDKLLKNLMIVILYKFSQKE